MKTWKFMYKCVWRCIYVKELQDRNKSNLGTKN